MPSSCQTIDFRDYGSLQWNSATRSTGLAAHAFAIAFGPFRDDSQRSAIPWHLRVVQTAVIGLWNQRRTREPILACYAVFDWMIKLYIVRRRGGQPPGVFHAVRDLPGYLECGREIMPLGPWLRPIVAWEPPSVMLVLWPPGADGSIVEPRVLDSGCMLGYSSYPASDHLNGGAIEKAGLDYVIVPGVDHDVFEVNGKEYHFTNRWFNIADIDE